MTDKKTPALASAVVAHAPALLTHRTWLLLRRIDEKSSFFFAPHVYAQEDAPALFTACIAGLENRMAAAGRSIGEAEANAIEMFQVLVDYAIENKTPLGFELGAGVPFSVVPVALEKGGEFFAALFEAISSAANSGAMEEWRSVPTSILVAASSQSTALCQD